MRAGICSVLVICGGIAAAVPPASPPAASSPAGADPLYELGRELFEQLPAEVKAQFAFPTREEWDAFGVRLQRALEGDSLEDLAVYASEARAAATALRSLGGYEDIADWLEQRIDEIEGAQQVVEQRQRAVPPQTTPPKTSPPPSSRGAGVPIPHYDLWLARVRNRPLPPRARELGPKLRAAFVAEGLPAELVWLAEAESSFNPAARSPAGAKGLFQFMPDTARSLGLSTFLPDDRTDPEKSARAAARYLRTLHGKFGSWPLALAAYNCGEGRVSRTLAARRARDFSGIADALPAETRMYVPKVCALIATRAGVTPEKLAAPARLR